MPKYNGHKNWNQRPHEDVLWNVSLWLNNDEGLYNQMKYYLKISINKDRAANLMFHEFTHEGMTHTPDGAPYSVSSIRAAMRGM